MLATHVVRPAVAGRPDRGGELGGGPDRGPWPLTDTASRPRGPGALVGQPLVGGIGDDRGAVGELDRVAGAGVQNLGGGDHPGGPAVGVEQLVADLDLTHRGPAGGRRQGRVQRQRLTDRRTRGDDDHLAWVQAVGQLVQLDEPGGHADHLAAAVADRLDLVERALHDRGERLIVLAGAALGDGVDLGLGGVDDRVDLAVAGVTHLRDAGAGLDQAAQDGALGHDLGVVAGVGRGRHRGQQRVQVRRPAGPGDLPALGQLGRDGDRVGRLAPPVQVEDGVVDQLVGRLVEVVGAQRLDDVGDGVLAQHHAAEHALLRGQILGRRAVELRVWWRRKFCNAHRRPSPIPARSAGPSDLGTGPR